jgi:hypothetical protein
VAVCTGKDGVFVLVAGGNVDVLVLLAVGPGGVFVLVEVGAWTVLVLVAVGKNVLVKVGDAIESTFSTSTQSLLPSLLLPGGTNR